MHQLFKDLDDKYFWDVDASKLNPERSDRLIIERVFRMGKVADIRKVIDYYGERKITEVLTRLNYLDPKTLNFVSKLFQIPPKDFKCYIRKQSNPPHWNS